MKKKLLTIVLAAAMVASMAACGSNPDAGSSGSGSAGGDSQQGSDQGTDQGSDQGTDQGSDQGTDQGSDQGGASGDVTDVALKVWCPQNQVDTGIMAEQQAAFAAEHPEWNITWTTEIVGEDNCKTEVLKDVEAAADEYIIASDKMVELVNAGSIDQIGGAA